MGPEHLAPGALSGLHDDPGVRVGGGGPAAAGALGAGAHEVGGAVGLIVGPALLLGDGLDLQILADGVIRGVAEYEGHAFIAGGFISVGETCGEVIGGTLLQLEALASQTRPNLALEDVGAAGKVCLLRRDALAGGQLSQAEVELGFASGLLAEQFFDAEALADRHPFHIVNVGHKCFFVKPS